MNTPRNPTLPGDEAATSTSVTPTIHISGVEQVGNSTLFPAAASIKVSLDCYLRLGNHWTEAASPRPTSYLSLTPVSAMPSDSDMTGISHLHSRPNHADGFPLMSRQPSFAGQTSLSPPSTTNKDTFKIHPSSQTAVDSVDLYRQPIREKPARYRRRGLRSTKTGIYSVPEGDTGYRGLQHGPPHGIGQADTWRNSNTPNNTAHKAANNIPAMAEKTHLRKERHHGEGRAEQPRIAKRREEADPGQSICSGQDHFYRSADNLSISSTPSSTSIVIRKMGKKVKKCTRRLVGLFHPRSVVGIPTTDPPVRKSSQVQLSMVTLDANLQDKGGGGTRYLNLERSVIDPTNADASSRDQNSVPGNAIRGSGIACPGKEPAEAIAVVKKGILRRKS